MTRTHSRYARCPVALARSSTAASAAAIAVALSLTACLQGGGGATGLVNPSTGTMAAEASLRGGAILNATPHAKIAPLMGMQLDGGYDWTHESVTVLIGPLFGAYALGDTAGGRAQLQFQVGMGGGKSGEAFAFTLRAGPNLLLGRSELARTLVALDAVTRVTFGSFYQWQLGVGLALDRLVWPPQDASFH